MNKRTLHRPLALLLALAMTLTLTSVPVLAADESATSGKSVSYVEVNGRRLNSGDSITCASFSDGTLTLNNYTGGGISASNGNLTIVVKGTNRIYEPNSWGIQLWHGNLTIQGEDATAESRAGSLTVHSSNSALMTYNGKLTVQNLEKLSCSSTTEENPVIGNRQGTMTFSNIGTMLVRGNTRYSAIHADTASPMTFSSIDTLEILNDNSVGLSAYDGLTIDDCGTVLTYSKNAQAIYIYAYYANYISKIKATRLIAIGSTGVYAYLNHDPVNLAEVGSMLVAGQSEALHGSITRPANSKTCDLEGREACIYPADSNSFKKATISIGNVGNNNTVSIPYTGSPVSVTASAVDTTDNQTISEQMTYVYTWYDAKGDMLMEAPTDVGTYTVKVYGFSNTYYSDFKNPATATVKITPVDVTDHYVTTLDKDIGKGNNVFDLPVIPDKMHYGTPEVTVPTTGSGETDSTASNAADTSKITASIGGSKLNVKAGTDLENNEKYTVTIPVEPDTGANYNEYDIVYTLTAQVNSYRFDLCDGSPVKTLDNTTTLPNTTLYDETDNTHGAWQSDIDTAKEFDYTFDGWYTAPNGWGTKVEGNSFTNGTTYFAHWVATRAVAGYANVQGKADPQLVYVKFNDGSEQGTTDERRTVYTTGLDFTNNSMPAAKNGEYEWNENTLTLKGVLVNSGTSSTALTLPGGANVVLDKDTRMENVTQYYDEQNNLVSNAEIPTGAKATAYNNFYGGGDKIPSMQVGQEEASGEETPDAAVLTEEAPAQQKYGLTISAKDPACAFSVRGGEVSVVGNLILGKNATLSTQGISVLGDVNLHDNSMLATVNLDRGQTRALDIFVGGSLDASGMLIVDGNITAEGSINLHGATLMSWGALQSNEITLSQLDPTSSCDRLESLGTITLNNTTLDLDGKVEDKFASVFAENLTVENGSMLDISGYQHYGIYANQMTVRNSTVNVEGGEKGALMLPNTEGKNGNLTLERARVTGPNGVRIETDELGQRAMVGDALSDTLLIQPYNHSSSSSSSNYAVNIAATKNGTVTPSATRVGSGSTVTLTVEPDGGYVLDSITAKDAAGKDVSLTKTADGKYTFKMPSSAVTVNASFRLRFTDVDPNAWYFDGVQDSVKKGLMEGMSETIFAPNGTLTRAQLVTILWRMEQQPSVNYALPFTDVVEGQWYTEAVRWAASTHVVNGTSATTFTPDAPVTREQLVTMLWRYAKQKGYDVSIGEETNILSYADATSVSEYAVPAMQWACGAGIIQGADGKLLPKDSTTRAQIATIFQRFGALKA